MPEVCCKKFFESLPDDEPVFILAGRDLLAAEVVEKWIRRAVEEGVPGDKILRAIEHRNAILRFQIDHLERTKMPD